MLGYAALISSIQRFPLSSLPDLWNADSISASEFYEVHSPPALPGPPKSSSPSDLFAHVIWLSSAKPLFKFLAGWDACQLKTDEKKRLRLVAGVLRITLHLASFFGAGGNHEKKLFYLKWQGDYVTPPVNMSHPRSDDDDEVNKGPLGRSTLCGILLKWTHLECGKHTHAQLKTSQNSQFTGYRKARNRKVFKVQSSHTEQGIRETEAFNG